MRNFSGSALRVATNHTPPRRRLVFGGAFAALIAGAALGASTVLASSISSRSDEARRMAADLEHGAAASTTDDEASEADTRALLEFTHLAHPSGGRVGARGVALLHLAIDTPEQFYASCSILSRNMASVLDENPKTLPTQVSTNTELAAALKFLGVRAEREEVRFLLGSVWIASSLIDALPEAVVMVANASDRTDTAAWSDAVMASLAHDTVTAFLAQVPDDDRTEFIAAFGVQGNDTSESTRAAMEAAVAKVCKRILTQDAPTSE